MAVVITIADVRADYETGLSDGAVQLAIDIVDGADDCLDARGVSDPVQRALKIYGARHQLYMQDNQGRGSIRSQTAPSGASQSFGGYSGKYGSPYGDLLKQQDVYGCVWNLFDNSGPSLFAAAVGGCYE